MAYLLWVAGLVTFLSLYRIADKRHIIFDGTGALLYGGRWNSPGHNVIYTSCSFAGAMLEMLTRVGRAGIPRTHQYIKISVTREIKVEQVPEHLKRGNIDKNVSREYGDLWLQENRTALLSVPSIVAPEEQNIIINPLHPDFKYIQASDPQPVNWDRRLFVQ
jgi:RES domain-containing protein